MLDLKLYYMKTCPFCQRVLDYLAQSNISVPLKDINDSVENRKELIDIGGKAQVPCLVIDGKALYESLDIIEWFKNHPETKAS